MQNNIQSTIQNKNFPQSNWKETTLGEVVEIVIDNRGKNPSYYTEKGIPVIDNVLIKENRKIDLKEARRFIDDNLYNNFIRKHGESGDVIITLVGNGYGNIVLFPNEKSVIIQNTVGLRVNKKSDNLFLYYLLKKDKKKILDLNIGAAQPSVKVGDLLNIKFLLPSLPEQQAIASVLSAFDDKIELLREQNKTLEEMGQVLFNYEFRMVNGELVKAQEILEFEKGVEVGSKNYFENKNDLENPEMFYRVGDISNNGNLSSLYCEKDLLKNRIFKSDDVLVSFDGTVGRVFIGGNGGYSSGIRKIFAKEKNVKNSFLYFWAKSEEVQETINLYSEGTTIQHAGKSIPYLEIISDQENINKITEPLDPIFTKILDNLYQIQSLARSRDKLLPRLMSGQIRVKL